jgi:hypothetical protein
LQISRAEGYVTSTKNYFLQDASQTAQQAKVC